MKKHNPLPESGYVRMSQLVGNPKSGIPPIIPVCRATIHNWMKLEKFPKPVHLSPAVTAWRVEDVRTFLDEGGVK